MNPTRRDFILSAAGAPLLSWPVGARAAGRKPRIGVLLLFAELDPEAQRRVKIFDKALREFGWIDGDNIIVDYRFGGGDVEKMRSHMMEMVALKADVVVSNAVSPIIGLQTIGTPPIVLAATHTEAEIAMMKDLSNRDVNITGLTTFDQTIVGKWLELLKAIVPGMTRAGLLFNPDAMKRSISPLREDYWSYWLQQLDEVALSLRISSMAFPVRTVAEVETALRSLERADDGGFVMVPDTFTVGHYRQIVAAAARHRVPACFPYRYFAVEGGLMSYGPNVTELFGQTASYVDRILKGTKASDLPIQRPNKFELALNLDTARELALDVPRTLLVRADEVIE